MSRIGKKPITLPPGVEAILEGDKLTVKGPKGVLELIVHPMVKITQDQSILSVNITNLNEKKEQALWGLFASLINNMVEGVTKGFEKKLEMNGIGFKAEVKGKSLVLDLGFSHQIDFKIIPGIEIVVEKNVIKVSGIDKQKVGNVSAEIRHLRPPEPYKGSGIKYADEKIRRKAGKASVKSGG